MADLTDLSLADRKRAAARRRLMSAEARRRLQDARLFAGLGSDLGPLTRDAKRRLRAVLVNPNEATWGDAWFTLVRPDLMLSGSVQAVDLFFPGSLLYPGRAPSGPASRIGSPLRSRSATSACGGCHEHASVAAPRAHPRRLSREERARVRALLDGPSVETCRRALGIEVAPGLRLWRAMEEANPTWQLQRKQLPSQLAVARALRFARRWRRGGRRGRRSARAGHEEQVEPGQHLHEEERNPEEDQRDRDARGCGAPAPQPFLPGLGQLLVPRAVAEESLQFLRCRLRHGHGRLALHLPVS